MRKRAVLCFILLGIVSFTGTIGWSLTATITVSGNPGNLAITAPGTGGADPVEPAADNTTYVQYTSTVTSGKPGGKTRRITAQITTGSLPAGTKLRLEASGIAGSGGTPVPGGAYLSTALAENIVTDIGDCTDARAYLTYTLSCSEVTSLTAISGNSITVTLTLTEEAKK